MNLDPFFAAAEADHKLPSGILRAIAIQESRLNPWASRFEPAFYKTYIVDKAKMALPGLWPQGVSEATERVARATSYGLMQVMGETAREMGFVGPFLTQLCDPETGIEWGAKVLRKKLDKYPVLADALSAYNAGVPIQENRSTYVKPILDRLTVLPGLA